MFKELFDREKLFQGLRNKNTFDTLFKQILIFIILFQAIYGFIYGYFVNEKNVIWALKDLVKFPVTFLLTILFSSPIYYFLTMILGSKMDYKDTLSIMLSGLLVMSTFTFMLGGILLILMSINNVSYSVLQATHGLVIIFGCLFGSIYYYFGLRITHQLNDNVAIALVLICGIIFITMLPQAAGIVGPYSSGQYSDFLKGISGMWGSAQMTKALR